LFTNGSCSLANTQTCAWFGSQISVICCELSEGEGLCPWTPLGDFRPQTLCAPYLQILATPLLCLSLLSRVGFKNKQQSHAEMETVRQCVVCCGISFDSGRSAALKYYLKHVKNCRSIAIRVSVCLSVRSYISKTTYTSRNFSYVLPVAVWPSVARPFPGDIAISDVFRFCCRRPVFT